MGKKCIICDEPAVFSIKDSRDYYCEDCAQENFNDLTLLQKVEEQTKIIKDMIKEKINDSNEQIKE